MESSVSPMARLLPRRQLIPRAAATRALGSGRHDFHRQRERSLLVRSQRADADQLAIGLFAAIVADRDDDRVLPWLAIRRMPDAALDAERRQRRRGRLVGVAVEAQEFPASRTNACAFENGLPAVRTRARRPGGSRAGAAHATVPLSTR